MEQAGENLEDYLVSMRQISDAVYYNVIKRMIFPIRSDVIQQGMDLYTRPTRGISRSIAVYNGSGSLIAAEPVAARRRIPNVTRQGLVYTGHGENGKHAFFHASYPEPV